MKANTLKVIAVVVLAFAGACGTLGTRADHAVRIAVISDLNSGYGSTEYDPEVTTAVTLIREWRPDLVLIPGDMIAGQRPALTDENVRAMWQAFDSVVAAPLRAAGIPFAFTLGNHDASGYPAHMRDRRLAVEHWRDARYMPALRFVDRSNFPIYYTFTVGDVFIAVIDATTGDVHADSAQRAWLSQTLKSAPARAARMRLTLGHVPLYAVAEGRNKPGEIQAQPDTLRALLEAGRVAMHISGHHHAYYPGRRGALELLHAGAAGSGPRPLVGSDLPPYKTVTLLTLYPARDSIADQTWRLDDATSTRLDPQTLPPRIDGINGYVIRRDLGRADSGQ